MAVVEKKDLLEEISGVDPQTIEAVAVDYTYGSQSTFVAKGRKTGDLYVMEESIDKVYSEFFVPFARGRVDWNDHVRAIQLGFRTFQLAIGEQEKSRVLGITARYGRNFQWERSPREIAFWRRLADSPCVKAISWKDSRTVYENPYIQFYQ